MVNWNFFVCLYQIASVTRMSYQDKTTRRFPCICFCSLHRLSIICLPSFALDNTVFCRINALPPDFWLWLVISQNLLKGKEIRSPNCKFHWNQTRKSKGAFSVSVPGVFIRRNTASTRRGFVNQSHVYEITQGQWCHDIAYMWCFTCASHIAANVLTGH